MKRFFLASLLLVVVWGCSGGPVVSVKDPGPAQMPAGAKLAESSDKTCSIAVVSGWKRGGPSTMVMPSLSESMSSMGGESSSLSDMADSFAKDEAAADAAEAAELEKKGILIWVNDSSRPIPGEARTSYRVRRKDDGPMSLEDAAEEAKQDLLNEGPIQYVDLPIGKAARMEASTTKVDGGQLFQIVYVIVNGEHIYDVRFTTQNDPSSVKNVEKQVIDSLRIKPAK
jgi:hypothetical protein